MPHGASGVRGMVSVLTRREEEVLRLIAVKGMTVRQTARSLVIADGTADAHMMNIRKKLGAHTTAHAVYLWLLAKGRQNGDAS